MKANRLLLTGAIVLCQATGIGVSWGDARAAEPAAPAAGLESDLPLGQGAEVDESLLPEEGEDEDLFGTKGTVHPYLTVAGEYTDNLYNLDTERVENFLFVVAPGLWFSLPAKKEIPVTLAPNNSSAGGYQFELEDYERTDRYQVFFLGDLDFRMYSDDSDLNDTLWRLQGLGRYNFPSGLTLQLLDAYSHSQDRFEIGRPDSRLTHIFDSNSLVGTIDWLVTEKFRFTGDLDLFSLVYDEAEFDYLERDDLGFDLHAFYNYSEKTSLFLEYKKVFIEYDSNTPYDSDSDFYYLGMTWDSTEKMSFLGKVGLQEKQYDNSVFDEFSGFSFEFQSVYRYSEKTKLTLDVYRQNEETDILSASDRVMLGSAIGYDQEITDKLSWGFRVRYELSEYRQFRGLEDREDDRILATPRVNYLFTDWLMAGLGYSYERRNSNYDVFDYYSNTFFADLKLAL